MARTPGTRFQPKPLRVRVERGTPGSYLWAPFAEHMKAAIVTLIPALVFHFVAALGQQTGNPTIGERFTHAINVTGEFFVTFGWVGLFFGAVYCAGWGWMSYGLVRAFRTRPSVYVHLAAHAVGGAIALLALVLAILALVQGSHGESLGEAETLGLLVVTAPIVGAAGSSLGVFLLKRSLGWYVTRVRPPLPEIEFVHRRNVRDDFERL